MTFIDFCAGIGGGRLGLELNGLQCIGYSEIVPKEASKLWPIFKRIFKSRNVEPFPNDNDFSIYVYGGIGYRFTLRNIYIQGNTWEDPFRQDLDPFVNYFEGGLALAYKGFELS